MSGCFSLPCSVKFVSQFMRICRSWSFYMCPTAVNLICLKGETMRIELMVCCFIPFADLPEPITRPPSIFNCQVRLVLHTYPFFHLPLFGKSLSEYAVYVTLELLFLSVSGNILSMKMTPYHKRYVECRSMFSI